MRRNIYLTADWHLFAPNIIKYCKRPQYNKADFKTEDKWVTDKTWKTEEIKNKRGSEMNSMLIKNYNSTIQANDTVYFVGDIGKGDQSLSVISKLKGNKILILGNHDKQTDSKYLNAGFIAVLTAAQIRRGKRVFNIQHYPNRNLKEVFSVAHKYLMRPDRKQTWERRWKRFRKEMGMYNKNRRVDGNWCIVGHVHSRWTRRGKNINCGADVWGFKPVNLDKIIRAIERIENGKLDTPFSSNGILDFIARCIFRSRKSKKSKGKIKQKGDK